MELCLFSIIKYLSYISLVIGVILFSVYKWSISTYDFFEKKGIDFIKPIPFFGSIKDMLLKKTDVLTFARNLYNHYPDKKFFGIFEMRNPVILVKDPDLIKQMIIKDFDNFTEHRIIITEEIDPLFGKNLFSLSGQKWKDMRSTLSPAFTGSKMRQIFHLIGNCCDDGVTHLLNESKQHHRMVVDMKDLFTRFTNDFIATAAFGVNVNSLKNKDNEFYTIIKKATTFNGLQAFKFIGYSLIPTVMKFFNIQIFEPSLQSFIRRLVGDTMQEREDSGLIRLDMIHLLMQAKKEGVIQKDSKSYTENDGFAAVNESTSEESNIKRKWDDDDLVAQCLIFLFAGFETSSILMSFVAHELTVNPDIQERLIDEIDDVRDSFEGKCISYDAIQGMKYMDMVVSECLRKWPPAPHTDRICSKPYKFESDGKEININTGDAIWIPIYGIHSDPKYYPNPNKFDPERFSNENKHTINSATYLPFGVGPRNCIGSRFALMECKAVLFYLLSAFTFEVSEKTQIPLRLAKEQFRIVAEKGFWIHLKPRS